MFLPIVSDLPLKPAVPRAHLLVPSVPTPHSRPPTLEISELRDGPESTGAEPAEVSGRRGGDSGCPAQGEQVVPALSTEHLGVTCLPHCRPSGGRAGHGSLAPSKDRKSLPQLLCLRTRDSSDLTPGLSSEALS